MGCTRGRRWRRIGMRMGASHPYGRAGLSARRPVPQKIFCPRRFAGKVGGRGVDNPRAINAFYPKPLFAEAVYCVAALLLSTGRHPFSTCRPYFSTGADSAPLFLSLFKQLKRERKESGKRGGCESEASTGYTEPCFKKVRELGRKNGQPVETRGQKCFAHQTLSVLEWGFHGTTARNAWGYPE